MFVLAIVLLTVGVGLALLYNRLVSLARRADGAWADIDAQLKRRHDLVPALVETVKGYAAHERQTLEEVVAQRTAVDRRAMAPDAATAAAENGLAGALRGLFALAEDYPDLRASDRFGMLQQQLSEIEDSLQAARRYYNAVVRDFNTAIGSFPALLVARPLGFTPRMFFELDNPMERQVPSAKLD